MTSTCASPQAPLDPAQHDLLLGLDDQEFIVAFEGDDRRSSSIS